MLDRQDNFPEFRFNYIQSTEDYFFKITDIVICLTPLPLSLLLTFE